MPTCNHGNTDAPAGDTLGMASKQKSRSPVGRRASKLVSVSRIKVSDLCDDDDDDDDDDGHWR